MDPGSLRQHSYFGVFTDGRDLFTKSLLGTEMANASRLVEGEDGAIYRPFPPATTKMAAMVKHDIAQWPFGTDSRVLYLGAGAGTTVSFMSDVCPEGQIFAVEFAPEPFRSLVGISRLRTNVVPIMADARRPSEYIHQVGPPVDVIYQDVAQRDQWEIAQRNARELLSPGGSIVLVVKAMSIDVSRRAHEVFGQVRSGIIKAGYTITAFVELDPYHRDHGVFVASRRGRR
jgi:fibrillarin-like pre-rRNA processing protein